MADYRTTFNPATGEHVQFLVTGLESRGALVRYRWVSDSGGSIVAHTHPRSAEVFTILDGESTFTVGGEQVVLTAGQTVVIPPGVAHSQANSSGLCVRGIVELTPAWRTDELHDVLAGISTDLPHTRTGAPRNLLQLGATFWAFRHDIRATTPPVWLQNIMLPLLAGAAHVAGVEATRATWSSRLADDEVAPDPLFDEMHFPSALTRAGYTFDLDQPRPLIAR
jgi:quercetin dioxygenase-like cupin family protein